MGYLAVTIGDDRSVAVHRPDQAVDPVVYETTTRLWFAEDGTVGLGPAGVDAGPSPRSASASISRVGNQEADPDGHQPEDLLAHAVNCLVAMATDRHGGVTPSVAVTYPDSWSPGRLAVLRGAFARTGLHGVLLVPNATAAGAFAALVPTNVTDPDPAPVADDVSLTIGALAVLEGPGPQSPDSAVTDALPIVAKSQALAFSEALPVDDPTTTVTPVEEDPHRKRRPLLIVTGAAVAVILASVAIAAAQGTFSDGVDVAPPAITDAQTAPATSSTATSPNGPVLPAVAPAVPFPTTVPEVVLQQPPSSGPSEPTLAEPPRPETPRAEPPRPETRAEPSPEPEPATPTPPRTRRPLTRPTVPDFTYPTVPDFTYPTAPRSNGAGR
ncbi:hypothetical protein QMK17_18335 [Rhodococcus sp. G-MC3]|uniref:hypothetical protein n=1 Tax=Rhodococcus sp. G-MC3 TaxID=3046209 RepID=UPI0024B98DCE|nr:hypothetical protein [Rhodococcus sp. G-MC3]MDJ0395289.1 hypothetical protein [Rhodococcus sp. G-MC3]